MSLPLWVKLFSSVAILAVSQSIHWNPPTDAVPAYYSEVPTSKSDLHPILTGSQLSGPSFKHSYQAAAYTKAAKVSSLLYQMPCFCRCDRRSGDKSLHSCFEKTHAAECNVCMQEAIYVYEKSQFGWSAGKIRAGLERGEWQNIDDKK
jgi:hypothetical protein